MSFELILPCLEYESSYGDYIRELGNEERYPFPLDFDHRDFAALLNRLNEFATGVNLPAEFVPASTYWLVQGGELIGVSNLRHFLNDRIRNIGGHIGLGIRPTYRGRGLGSLLLALTLEKARKMGITPVHVHCHKNNVASARMIASNGGVLDSETLDPEAKEVVQRYHVSAVDGLGRCHTERSHP